MLISICDIDSWLHGVLNIVQVPANDAKTVYFWIVPKSLGQIPIEVHAQSNEAGDAERRLLLVKVSLLCAFFNSYVIIITVILIILMISVKTEYVQIKHRHVLHALN